MPRIFSSQMVQEAIDRSQYQAELTGKRDRDLIKEFLSYFDYTEEDEMGKTYHPIRITCSRVQMTEPMRMVLQEMWERIE